MSKKEPKYRVSFWFRKVLVPFDSSGPSKKALELAKDFSYRYGSAVDVIYVCTICEEAERVKTEALSIFPEAKFFVRKFDPAESSVTSEILKVLDEGDYDAVILGARGNSLDVSRPLGSVTSGIMMSFSGTIIVVR